MKETLPPDVTIEELEEVLALEGVAVHFDEKLPEPLWKGKRVTVSKAKFPFSPYHLWISVNGKKTLDECTKEELAELYEGIWRGREALKRVVGADSFILFTTEQERYGKGSEEAGFEILTMSRQGANGVQDAFEKMVTINYMFYNQFPKHAVPQSEEDWNKIKLEMQNANPSVQPEEPQGNWTQKLSRHEESLHSSLGVIHAFLGQSGALLEGAMSPKPTSEGVHEILIDLDRCAFCNPKVIERQQILTWKDVHILVSHKPFTLSGNYLILPTRHQCSWDLTPLEVEGSFEGLIAIKKMLSKEYGRESWIAYVQDGPSSGQTVPHTPLHLYVIPSPVKLAMSNLQHIHNKRKILTPEQMRASAERVKPLILEALQCQ
jgi:diadenosine tetraphosphate (Ap4A) HIT family hydrolase